MKFFTHDSCRCSPSPPCIARQKRETPPRITYTRTRESNMYLYIVRTSSPRKNREGRYRSRIIAPQRAGWLLMKAGAPAIGTRPARRRGGWKLMRRRPKEITLGRASGSCNAMNIPPAGLEGFFFPRVFLSFYQRFCRCEVSRFFFCRWWIYEGWGCCNGWVWSWFVDFSRELLRFCYSGSYSRVKIWRCVMKNA